MEKQHSELLKILILCPGWGLCCVSHPRAVLEGASISLPVPCPALGWMLQLQPLVPCSWQAQQAVRAGFVGLHQAVTISCLGSLQTELCPYSPVPHCI